MGLTLKTPQIHMDGLDPQGVLRRPPDAVCRGSWSLGNACGTCEKCRKAVAWMIAELERLRKIERPEGV